MRALSIAGLTLLSAIVVVLGIAALLPDTYEVRRSIVIQSDPATLTARLADLGSRESWIPWKDDEPTATFRSTGAPGQPGSTFSWNGTSIGSGTVTLLEVRGTQEIATRVDFERPMPMVVSDRFALAPAPGGGTIVTWTNSGPLDWPMGRLFGLVADAVVGGDYERGLAKLKRVAEGQTVARQ